LVLLSALNKAATDSNRTDLRFLMFLTDEFCSRILNVLVGLKTVAITHNKYAPKSKAKNGIMVLC